LELGGRVGGPERVFRHKGIVIIIVRSSSSNIITIMIISTARTTTTMNVQDSLFHGPVDFQSHIGHGHAGTFAIAQLFLARRRRRGWQQRRNIRTFR
jgi:hypothetical protein